MTFPTCNPIDYGWFNRGVPIDYIGTVSFHCKVCDASTSHEKFFIVVGSAIGIGAPFFAKPFMKRSSTSGKMGGTRGHVVQCTKCNSLWPADSAGSDALTRAGLSRDGLVALDRANEYRNRLAKEEEDQRRGPSNPDDGGSDSKVTKFRD
jgi:hypothetical protein